MSLDKKGQVNGPDQRLDLGIPVTLIAEAVFARCLSALKEERVRLQGFFPKPSQGSGTKRIFIDDIAKALYASKIISYAQGFMLMRAQQTR